MNHSIDYFKEGSGIVTLCGSTKFFHEFTEANRILTFNNWVVLSCGSWGHSYHKYSIELDKDYTTIKKLHLKKIMMSNCIVVVSDKTFYIGDSTKLEIAFANDHGLPIFYYDGENFTGTSNKKPPNVLDKIEDKIDYWIEKRKAIL
ncbi:hypothetical protein [Nostoc phage A1]|nr:hypothetical protein [Nostoc phage A1]